MKDRILYEDEHFVAVNKRAGELTIADRWGKEARENILLYTLGDFLRSQGHQPDESGRDLYPVHRLDRDTSGVVLFAKNDTTHRELSKLFEGRDVEKVYWAFVAGSPAWDECSVNLPLKRLEGKSGRGRAIVHITQGKPAQTELTVLERFASHAWIEAKPKTGRLHQIRIHLRVLEFPVVNDPLYGWEDGGKRGAGKGLQRMPLHARKISFIHPMLEKEIAIECPMDEAMRTMLSSWKEANRDARRDRGRRSKDEF